MLDSLCLPMPTASPSMVRFDRDYSRRRVVLPTYPFQRQRYWIESSDNGHPPATVLTHCRPPRAGRYPPPGSVTGQTGSLSEDHQIAARSRQPPRRAASTQRSTASIQDWLTSPVAAAAPGGPETTATLNPALADSGRPGGVGRALAALLSRRGHRCVLVDPETASERTRSLSPIRQAGDFDCLP